ncbi:hypothetical protein BDZ91DRAFT_104029 [Kalaharituber pfeilii]|nr:hypothetical protein BDZ91DRAFT_104029 [Kalaharituber pfeilii]
MPRAPPSSRSFKPFGSEPYPSSSLIPSSSSTATSPVDFSTAPLPPISTLPPPSSLTALPPISSISALASLPPISVPPASCAMLPAPPTAISSLLNPHPLPSSQLSGPPAAISAYPSSFSSTPVPASATSSSSNPKPATTRGRSKNDHLPWLTTEVPTVTTPDGETYIPIYDDCNEIRRKIRAFFSNNNTEYKCTQKYFLEVIGNVNSNSYRRFMAAKGEGGGAENGTYTGAYVFF